MHCQSNGVLVELSSSQLGSVRVVGVHGRLDHAHAKAFEAALAPHLAVCTAAGTPIVLDFANVVYISSVGLRVLLLAAKQVKAQQGRIAIAALTPVVTEVFQVSHFNLVLKVFPDLAAAASDLSAG
ncbi:MAG: STAS domain-containing protein [Rhodoferax sp.]|nr:STAS domain-containing protein [Rhodoferax sp.]